MEARGPGWVNRVELLAGLLPATLLLAPFVLTGTFGIVVAAVTVLPHPQRPLGEELSHLQADAFFLLLALGAVLGLALLWTVVVLGRETVSHSPVLRPGVSFSILSGLTAPSCC